MIRSIISCDVCGSERGQSNHWILAVRSGYRSVSFHPWNEKMATGANSRHLCGSECAVKFLNEVMGEEKPKGKSDDAEF